MGPEPYAVDATAGSADRAVARHSESGAISSGDSSPVCEGNRVPDVDELRGYLRAALAEARDQRTRADTLERELRASSRHIEHLEAKGWAWRLPADSQEHGPYPTREAALAAARAHLVDEIRARAGADVDGQFREIVLCDRLEVWTRLPRRAERVQLDYDVRPGRASNEATKEEIASLGTVALTGEGSRAA